jgi:hypothetical protein
VLAVIQAVEDNEWQWISSDAVAYEISKAPNEERQERLSCLGSARPEPLSRKT